MDIHITNYRTISWMDKIRKMSTFLTENVMDLISQMDIPNELAGKIFTFQMNIADGYPHVKQIFPTHRLISHMVGRISTFQTDVLMDLISHMGIRKEISMWIPTFQMNVPDGYSYPEKTGHISRQYTTDISTF